MKSYNLVRHSRVLDWQYRVGFERDGVTEFECWREIDARDKSFPRYFIRKSATGETLSSRLEIEPSADRTWGSRLSDFISMHDSQRDLVFRKGHAERFRLRRLGGPLAREVVIVNWGEFPVRQSQRGMGWTRIGVRGMFSFHVVNCHSDTLKIIPDDDWTWIAIAVAYFKWARFSDSG